jgi:hypothetical protein
MPSCCGTTEEVRPALDGDMTDDQSPSAVQSDAPEALLAAGYERRSRTELGGEYRLMLAILEEAIVVYERSQSARVGAKNAGRDAREWLESRSRSSPFAFESICDLLGLDSGHIRCGLGILSAGPGAPRGTARGAAPRHRGAPRRIHPRA